jgi:hypothetical protein
MSILHILCAFLPSIKCTDCEKPAVYAKFHNKNIVIQVGKINAGNVYRRKTNYTEKPSVFFPHIALI